MLVLFTVFCSVRLRDSRLGRAWIAIREDDGGRGHGSAADADEDLGVRGRRFFGGIAGAFYSSFKSGTFPDDFFFNISIFILAWSSSVGWATSGA